MAVATALNSYPTHSREWNSYAAPDDVKLPVKVPCQCLVRAWNHSDTQPVFIRRELGQAGETTRHLPPAIAPPPELIAWLDEKR